MLVLPYYLAIGMPYELFWNGDPNLVKTYREAHELRNQQKNQEMWIQGIYFLRGVQTVAEAIASSFGGSKGSKINQYPNEPLPFTEAEQKAFTERNKRKTLEWVQSNQH